MKLRFPALKLKRRTARKTGIFTRKSGRSRKLDSVTGGLSGILSTNDGSDETKGRRPQRTSGSKGQSGAAVVAIIIGVASGYFFGVIVGVVVFLVALILFPIIIAKKGAIRGDAIRSQERGQPVAFSPADPALEPIELHFTLRELPQEKTTARGGSYDMEEDKYQLDLGQTQCSCRGWENRKRYPIGDPRRLCRHLVRALRERNLIQGNDEWSEAIIANDQGIPLKAWHARLDSAPDALVTIGDSDTWLDIFAREKRSGERIAEASGPIVRYGWSVIEKRWSYGENVPGARELNKLLRAATPSAS